MVINAGSQLLQISTQQNRKIIIGELLNLKCKIHETALKQLPNHTVKRILSHYPKCQL